MNFNIKITVPEKRIYLLTVPEGSEFKVVNYGFAGTWLMETKSDSLNNWKVKIDQAKWEILGYIDEVFIDEKPETEHNFALRYL